MLSQPWCQISLVIHSSLLVTHQSTAFDNCGNLMILLLTTKIMVSHFGSANFYCFIMKNSNHYPHSTPVNPSLGNAIFREVENTINSMKTLCKFNTFSIGCQHVFYLQLFQNLCCCFTKRMSAVIHLVDHGVKHLCLHV